jgi:TetR/AcrR family transcriptional regulator, regulator of cefoperazone and chloramphenicol sensitivity
MRRHGEGAPRFERPPARREMRRGRGQNRADRDDDTRERLLATAVRLFAHRGFKKVTVRQICREAHANVAAVNYYFGDKLGLYRDVLQSAIDRMRATIDEARGASAGHGPEEQLRQYIFVFTRRLFTDRSHTVHRLITREMNDPTPAIDAIVEQGIRPRLEFLSAIVAEIIGCDPADPRVLRCVASVWAQSFAFLPNPIAERLGATSEVSPGDVEAIAQHVTEFSLAGIRQIARGGPS